MKRAGGPASPLQSQWFQRINHSQHKPLWQIMLSAQPSHLLFHRHSLPNYFMIGKEKHRPKGDNALVIICLHWML